MPAAGAGPKGAAGFLTLQRITNGRAGVQAAARNSRPFHFGTNFKMHQTPQQTARFLTDLAPHLERIPSTVRLFVIPPFTSLSAAIAARKAAELASRVWIGAQNVHWAAEGAYTGEISIRMLTSIGTDLVLLGHAERRGLFGETDESLAKKVPAALDAGLRVLLCVGETAEEKAYGVGPETVTRQLKIALNAVTSDALPQLMIGYEPVWSIGAAGTAARPSDVMETVVPLRHGLRDRFGEAGETVPILYGGSVSSDNCGDFVTLDEIDGLFVGRAGWQVEGFERVLEAALASHRDIRRDAS